jgi:hypothetical protein
MTIRPLTASALILLLTLPVSGSMRAQLVAVRHIWTGPPPADLDDTWAVSPDGQLLAYRDEQSHLAFYRFASAESRQLAEEIPPRQRRHPSDYTIFRGPSPGCRTVNTSSSAKCEATRRSLWRVSVASGNAEPLGIEVDRKNLHFLRVSANGERLAFVMGDYDVRPLEVWALEHFLR